LVRGLSRVYIGTMKRPHRLVCGKPVVPSRAIANREPSTAELEAAHRRAMSFMSEREDEWRERPTDRTMAELVGEGFELVTVIPSGRDYTYFLKARGKLAKCREATTLDVSNPPPPLPRPPRDSAQPMPMPEDMPSPEIRVTVECFELVGPDK
jgi:hypothetical protein